jgi:O-antigen/teichoic acid export membrane protein
LNLPQAASDSRAPEPVRNLTDTTFTTSHLLKNFKSRVVSSTLITISAQGLQFALMLGSTAILARLLNPRDYGLIAMVTTVFGLLRLFNDAGLATVTVQREGITDAQVSNLFWINLIVAGSGTVCLALASPLIAWFYREPLLVRITLVLSVTYIFAGSTAQHTALLQRQMRFMAVAGIQLASMVFSILVGIGMAWSGYGYWSLVGLQVTQSAATMVLTWSFSRWRPRLPSRGHGMKSLVGFGAHLTATSFIWSLSRGADTLLLGRIYGSESVGLYSRAGALLNRPLDQVLGPIHSVFVPVFSRMSGDPQRYRRTFLQVFEVVALSSFLCTALFLALSYELTVFVLGHRWEAASAIFAGLAPSAIFLPICSATSWLLVSQGRGKEWLTASTLNSCVAVMAFGIGSRFGPVWVAVSYSIAGLIVLLPIVYYTAGRRGPVNTVDLWRASLRALPVWFVVAATTFIARWFLADEPLLVKLAASGTAGLCMGLAFVWAYPPTRETAIGLTKTIREFLVAT